MTIPSAINYTVFDTCRIAKSTSLTSAINILGTSLRQLDFSFSTEIGRIFLISTVWCQDRRVWCTLNSHQRWRHNIWDDRSLSIEEEVWREKSKATKIPSQPKSSFFQRRAHHRVRSCLLTMESLQLLKDHRLHRRLMLRLRPQDF